jgi:hypothetical protein
MTQVRDLLPGDAPSESYKSLIKYIPELKDVDGISIEIGLRRGGGTLEIIEAFLENDDKRPHVCVDPYGDIEYWGHGKITQYDYFNSMRNEAISNLYKYADVRGVNIIFYNLEDSEFYERFADGVPVYDRGTKTIVSKYCLVHIDGQHDVKSVDIATDFFIKNLSVKGVIVYDNTDYYEHNEIHNKLLSNNFEVLIEENVHSYKKVYRKL